MDVNTQAITSVISLTAVGHSSTTEDITYLQLILDVYTGSTNQTSPMQVGILHHSFIQLGTNQASVGQIRSTENRLSESGSIQPHFTQNGITQINLSQLGSVKVTSSEIDSSHRGTQNGTTEIGISQDNSFQFTSPCTNSDSSKIALTSRISFEQFLSTHFGKQSSLHDSASLSVRVLESLAVSHWSRVLQTSSPIALNLIIKDLPIGQLAEAQITQFDSQGQPIAGTLLLDHNANGLGWFIDSTLFDNSEFAFKATPGSAAYDRYDLLKVN